MSIFDFLDKPKVDNPQEDNMGKYLKEAIMHGTGFVGGKERVYKLYQQEMTSKERAYAIKKEYGIGGAGWPIDGCGLHGYMSDAKGIKIEWIDEAGNHEKLFNWDDVERVIYSLVETGEYYKPKKRTCAATNEECNHDGCKEVSIKCLGIDCKAECCQKCTEDCGARCNYSAHQPKVLKEYKDIGNQTWVDNPNFNG